MKRNSTLIAAVVILLIAAAAAGWVFVGDTMTPKETVAEFYRGKTIELKIGYSPGGGYDGYARVLARHMGRHIPGNPTIIPTNMSGKGSLLLTNHLYNEAPRDGTVFGIIGRGIAMEPLLGGDETNFLPTRFNWIGSLNNEVSVCVASRASDVRRWEDLMTRELVVGGTGSGSDTDTLPTLLGNMFGARLTLVSGYPGGSDILRAIEKGEVQGRCGWSWGSARNNDLITNGQVYVLLQMALQKHPDLPNVPLIMDLARNDDDRSVLLLLFARQAMGRPFVAPPGVPEDRMAALRRAFDLVVRDPVFLADAEREGLEIQPANYQVIQDVIEHVYQVSTPTLVARASALVSN
ncbi:MAG: hypothetical protein HKM95_04715 [Inquilinus sp.]|nr:hypothetical protein [Inquilinus sp.]